MVPDPDYSEDGGGGFSFTFEPTDKTQPTMTIVDAVAWIKRTDPLVLKPLDRVVDTEGLNNLYGHAEDCDFHRSSSQPASEPLRTAFEYEGCTVTIADHYVQVELLPP